MPQFNKKQWKMGEVKQSLVSDYVIVIQGKKSNKKTENKKKAQEGSSIWWSWVGTSQICDCIIDSEHITTDPAAGHWNASHLCWGLAYKDRTIPRRWRLLECLIHRNRILHGMTSGWGDHIKVTEVLEGPYSWVPLVGAHTEPPRGSRPHGTLQWPSKA